MDMCRQNANTFSGEDAQCAMCGSVSPQYHEINGRRFCWTHCPAGHPVDRRQIGRSEFVDKFKGFVGQGRRVR
jgi:hypothetical protein